MSKHTSQDFDGSMPGDNILVVAASTVNCVYGNFPHVNEELFKIG